MGRLTYDGTAYLGFQRQGGDAPTIQASVEDALSTVAGHPVGCIAAGRTDTGVHASGQVISWQMEWQHPLNSLLRATNLYLPGDIALQTLAITSEGFHPRFSALSRTYLYRIYIAPARDPLRQRYVWHYYRSLDIVAMAQAAQLLEGVHDFATFGQPPSGTTTIRHVIATNMQKVADEIHFTITANAFLQRMARSIVGALVDVGREKTTIKEFEEAFLAADRMRGASTAPPQGLVLTQVTYEKDPFTPMMQPATIGIENSGDKQHEI